MPEGEDTETPKPTVDEKLAAAEAKNAQLEGRMQAQTDAFKALGIDPSNPPPRAEPDVEPERTAPPTGGGLSPDVVSRLSAATGWDADTVRGYYPIFAAMLSEIASPALNALAGVADKHDYLETLVELPEKMKDPAFKKRIEAERRARVGRGDFRSRKEIAGLLIAQDADTPQGVEAAKVAFDARVEEAVNARLGRDAAETEGPSTEKAGPAAGKGGGGAPSMTKFTNMTGDEQATAIGLDTPI